jgi:hypothetical protein
MPTAGIKGLRRLQLGKEATPGTAVASTALLDFNGTIKDDRELIFPDEAIGYLPGRTRTYTGKYGASLEMEGPLSFEQFPYILDASVAGATPTSDGTGSGMIYVYTFPTTTATPSTDLFTYTIEGGDNVAAEEMEFSYIDNFSLSGRFGEAWNLSATWKARQCSTSTFTPSSDVTVTTVESVLFTKTKLYVNATTDTIGTTEIAGSLIEAELSVDTGWSEKPVASGNLYFNDVKMIAPEILLTITMEHDSNSIAQKDAWRAETARLIRLNIFGTALASAGTTYTYKTVNIDLAGKWESWDKIDEIDGNDITKGVFRARYDTTAAFYARITVVNELTAMP